MDPFSMALMAGSLGTGIAGLARKQPNYGYSKGDLDYLAAQRSGQIDSFAKELAAFRDKYASQIRSFGTNAFNRFSGDAEAGYAAKGFAPNGGAFQSALARKAAEIQDNEMNTLGQMEHGDIGAVDNARAGLFGAQAGFSPSGPSSDPGSQALGGLSSALMSLGFANMGNQPKPGPAPVPYATPGMFNYAPAARRSVLSNRLNLDYAGR